MTNALIMISIVTAMAWAMILLDWLGRRKDRRSNRSRD